MRQLQPVIWSKGVFLSPQHLQAQDRFFEETLRFHVEALSFRHWGFSDLQLDATALSEGSLSITSASGIFADGLLFDIPASDPAPRARLLDECFRDGRVRCVFYLALPQQRPGGLNVALHRGGVSTRFYAELQMLRDENSNTSERPVSVARKNLQILADGENLEGSALLPIAAIEKTEAGTYRFDPRYVPPMVNLKGSDYLTGILRGQVELLIARSSQLAGARRQRNQSLADFSASDIANFWLLYTLNTHLPLLRHLHEVRGGHPSDLWEALVALAGALSTFAPNARALPTYEHDRLGECFAALEAQILELLETAVPESAMSLPLRVIRPAVQAVAIEQEKWLAAPHWYLAVSAPMRQADLLARVLHGCKVGSADVVDTLIRQALSGLEMTHVPQPPGGVPLKMDFLYFALQRAGSAWDAIARSRNLAVYVPAELLEARFELVIVLR